MTTLAALIDRILGGPPPAPARTANSGRWPGLYLGVGAKGPVFAGPEHHCLVIGPPRSGKTTRLMMPVVAAHPGPVVVTSTKPDVLAATIVARARRGRCLLWDPTATTPTPAGVQPLCWSPIVGCGDWDQAVARAHALAAAARPARTRGYDSHWVERAQALLAPLLHAAALIDADMACLLSWLHHRELLQPISLLNDYRSAIAANVLEGIAATDPREQSGIFSTADGLLAAYRTNAALSAARHPDFDPAAFVASTDTVYICAPATAQAQHAALVVALLDQIRTAAYQTRPRPPMLWGLDELAHVAPLPDLPATVAEGGSQGLIVLACLQDLSQARSRWGPAADGFLTLFAHTIILPGVADLITLRQISALAGEIDIPYRSTSRPNRLFAPTTVNTHMQTRPRLPVDTIAIGRPGQALLITRSQPSRVNLPPPTRTKRQTH
jgi:type IV secretion system protein VirD4